ncbi:MAG: restriction endonuclease [Flavobacteriaceae bacterium]|nr:restriction endonuclease [Flavobacteriaceae bacterium]
MKKEKLSVKKNSDKVEFFSSQKLKKSLQACGATEEEVESITHNIQPQIYDGISSNEIHKKAFTLLKKCNRVYASKYNLKRAIFDLGPTGYPFERLVGALLREKGYKTKVSVILNGECVTYEIDVLAEKDGNVYAIECKFHSNNKTISNVKVPLYINSRFLDVQKQWNSNSKNKSHLRQGWLVTNTRFTKEAVNYAKCVGLTLLSWDYPKNNGMKANIDTYGLYPITALTSLTKKEKKQLIAIDIILTKELLKGSEHLKKIRIQSCTHNNCITWVIKHSCFSF